MRAKKQIFTILTVLNEKFKFPWQPISLPIKRQSIQFCDTSSNIPKMKSG